MTDLSTAQLPLIKAAADVLDSGVVRRYIQLRQLLGSDDLDRRERFKAMFANYYGLNSGGVTDRFREVYFTRLYELRCRLTEKPPYAQLLREFYEIPRHKGDKALVCSFVSKLIAIHDESRPLFDRYVSHFFGLSAPQSTSLDLRIAGFVSNLEIVRTNYNFWIEEDEFLEIFRKLRERINELHGCHLVRVCDFLVWQAGKLDRKTSSETGGPLAENR